MTRSYDTRRVSFHDSGLLRLSHEGRRITMTLEDVTDGDDLTKASVVIDGVEGITRNGVVVADLKAEADDSEVMRLAKSGAQIEFIVYWRHFHLRTQLFCIYALTGENISMSVTLGE